MAKIKQKNTASFTEAKFPYTNKPGSLRKLLKAIPTKPKPPKFDTQLLKSWGFRDGNDYSMVRVLKAVDLLNEKNEPNESYSQFMSLDRGARILGAEIRRLYAPLFNAAHKPYDETADKLKNLFNIHSGGGERGLELQMQTFKALCESASFDPISPVSGSTAVNSAVVATAANAIGASGPTGQPTVNINLHIHLPENKTRRDYTDIIEDIGRYIFGRTNEDRRE
jgi:hypothetical protein